MVRRHVRTSSVFAKPSHLQSAIQRPTLQVDVQLVIINLRTQENDYVIESHQARSIRAVSPIYTLPSQRFIPRLLRSSQLTVAMLIGIRSLLHFSPNHSRPGSLLVVLILAIQALHVLHGKYALDRTADLLWLTVVPRRSDLCSNKANRAAFISSLENFMQSYKFQGVDIDWEYPGTPQRGGQRADTENFVSLVKEMRAAYGKKYGISVTLAPDYWYLRGFDAKAMEPSVDWFGFMAYDLHGSWDADIKTLGSKVRGQTNIEEIYNDTLPLWFDALDPAKINMGLAFYGRGKMPKWSLPYDILLISCEYRLYTCLTEL